MPRKRGKWAKFTMAIDSRKVEEEHMPKEQEFYLKMLGIRISRLV